MNRENWQRSEQKQCDLISFLANARRIIIKVSSLVIIQLSYVGRHNDASPGKKIQIIMTRAHSHLTFCRCAFPKLFYQQRPAIQRPCHAQFRITRVAFMFRPPLAISRPHGIVVQNTKLSMLHQIPTKLFLTIVPKPHQAKPHLVLNIPTTP